MNSFLMFLICVSATIESLIDHRLRTVRLPITNCDLIFPKTETLVKFFSGCGWKKQRHIKLIANFKRGDSKAAVSGHPISGGFFRRS